MDRLKSVSPLNPSGEAIDSVQNESVILEEVRVYELLRLQVFSRGEVTETSLAAQSGLPLPGAGALVPIEQGFICWSAPCEWIIAVSADDDTQMAKALTHSLDGVLHSISVITDSRVLLRISGIGARRLLAMGSGVDYHPSVFKAGTCVTTKLAGVAAMVLQPEIRDEFLVFVDRSHADYLRTWLSDAAIDMNSNPELTRAC